MTRTAPDPRQEIAAIQELLLKDTSPIEDKLVHLTGFRATTPENAALLDRFLVELVTQQRRGLVEGQRSLRELQRIVEKLTAPPLHLALFLQMLPGPSGPRALVQQGQSLRVCSLAEEVRPDSLALGDEVLLNQEASVVLARSSLRCNRSGDTAVFDRVLPDGRWAVKLRDEEIILWPVAALQSAAMKPGDLVRFDRSAWMAFERLERAEGKQFLLEETPTVTRAQVGGQDGNLEEVLFALTVILLHPELASLYQLDGKRSILMHGPPGCGKTLIARVGAAEIGRLSGRACRFGVVKPGEWESPWVGVTQENIRNTFRALRDASANGFAVLFLDEIEAIGRIRGGMVSHHSDKFLAALLAELDGFADRRNVAIIAATNRKDLVDPALLERLSDVEIQITRPDLRAARAILQVHLTASVPYSPNGASAEATRSELIETAVSRFYSPNGDNDLCVVKFRNNKTRTVTARELVSGRIFEQLCRAARSSALRRHAQGGQPGLCVTDMENAVAETLQRLRTTLTPHNIRSYLHDLQADMDMDVVSVEPVVRKVPRPHQFLNLADAEPGSERQSP